MLRIWPLFAAGLMLLLQSGCGQELGGDSRRNASGNMVGVGLGTDLGSVPPVSAPPAPQGAAPSPAGAAAPASTATSPPPPGSAPPPPGSAPGPGAPPPPGAATPAAQADPQPQTVRETAAAGASGKGNYEPGVITTPVSVYFQARERIVFEIEIPHAINLYEATNGFKPKTQESFMKDIIEFNHIKLPELPPAHKYLYDPKTGELMIERPA